MILDESLFDEAMYTNITSNPYDLNIMKSKLDDENGRDWKYIKSFKFKDDAIERANRMIANGEAYVAQVYSWKNEDHGEIYFRKADDGTVIDKSVQHIDSDIHGPEIKTVSDKTIIKPVKEAKEQKCVICKKTITGYGNNAEPVAKGQCCDKCNAAKVIPARIAQLYGIKNKNINEDLNSNNYIDLFKIKSNYTEQFIKDLEQGSYTEDVFENAKEAYDIDDLQVTVIINNDNTVKYPFIYGRGINKRCIIFTNLHDYANEIDQDYQDILNKLSEITGVSKEILIGDYIEENLKEDINNNRIAELEDALEAMEARHDPSEREDIEELKAEIEKLKAERNNAITLPDGVEDAGTSRFGDKLYKYKNYTIAHFPYDITLGDRTNHVEAYVIESPAVLTNSGYHLPLYCEDEKGSEVNFRSLEQVKAWIDKFDGKFKLEYKHGDELHAVIKDEFINESLTEDVEIVSLTNEQSNENNALSTIINALIKDEFDAIQGYNDAIVNFETEGRGDLVQVLKDIANEENLHVGQLEVLLEQVSSSANSIDQGKAEAEEQLSDELVMESLQQSDKEEIEEIAKGDFESGHIFAEDYEEFKSQLRGENIKVTKELYNYYKELKDLGPTGFYQEFKNKFDFDPDFVAEFGEDEEDEDPEEGMHY